MKLLSHISIFLIISLTSFNLFSYEVKNGVLRTPDERFQNLKDYPYEPNYMMIDGLRIHYLDEDQKMRIQFSFCMENLHGVIYFVK